jgi:uncharacterized protein
LGTGISGLSAAWLLSKAHEVTVYERADRVGGHSNTVILNAEDGPVPVDTGFIVFNRKTYPNLSALFGLLNVQTRPTDMSFGVSLDAGGFEYSGGTLAGLFARPRNAVDPQFWRMVRDLLRFYREAPHDAPDCERDDVSLGQYLTAKRYSAAFKDRHLLPMASAVWSAAPETMLDYPAAAFIRFHANHGLLQIYDRPAWETVVGGSRNYVSRLTDSFRDRIRLRCAIVSIRRGSDGVSLEYSSGEHETFDHVVIATHAHQAQAMLVDPSAREQQLLSCFRYTRNLAVLHTDTGFMPRRRSAWSSWNYVAPPGDRKAGPTVTYWMNRLQGIRTSRPILVTLNPNHPPHAGTLLHSEIYEHPIFDGAALNAQYRLWSLQGYRRTWFCGSYFGAGFHEDGLQAGLAVAEELGGVRRPWSVPDESGRIVLSVSLAREPLSGVDA